MQWCEVGGREERIYEVLKEGGERCVEQAASGKAAEVVRRVRAIRRMAGQSVEGQSVQAKLETAGELDGEAVNEGRAWRGRQDGEGGGRFWQTRTPRQEPPTRRPRNASIDLSRTLANHSIAPSYGRLRKQTIQRAPVDQSGFAPEFVNCSLAVSSQGPLAGTTLALWHRVKMRLQSSDSLPKSCWKLI